MGPPPRRHWGLCHSRSTFPPLQPVACCWDPAAENSAAPCLKCLGSASKGEEDTWESEACKLLARYGHDARHASTKPSLPESLWWLLETAELRE